MKNQDYFYSKVSEGESKRITLLNQKTLYHNKGNREAVASKVLDRNLYLTQ